MRKFLFWVKFNLWWPLVALWMAGSIVTVLSMALLNVAIWGLTWVKDSLALLASASLDVVYRLRPTVPLR